MFKGDSSHSPLSPLPLPLHPCPCLPPPPRKKSWICPLYAHNLTILPHHHHHHHYYNHHHDTHTQSEFGFFVKIHLLENLKLALYDLYFRSYSFVIILFLKCGLYIILYRVLMVSMIVFYLKFYLFCTRTSPPSSLHPPPPDKDHRAGKHHTERNN